MTSPTPTSAATTLADRNILVGVTGGIAAYKTASLVSKLAQAGAKVTVAMTESATRFVTPLTFQALSAQPVYTSPWDQIDSFDPQHIALAERTDLASVAPCTMDCLARLALGHTSDAVTLILSAVDRAKTPVLLSPSMNAVMWRQPATQRHIATLAGDGFTLIEPASGWQACRTDGPGRMPEPETLFDHVVGALPGP